MRSSSTKYEYVQIRELFTHTYGNHLVHAEGTETLQDYQESDWELVSSVAVPLPVEQDELGHSYLKTCVIHSFKRALPVQWDYLQVEVPRLVSLSNSNEDLELSRLGIDGWEAYSRDKDYVYLKRKIGG